MYLLPNIASIFHKTNPYSIYNIKIWLKINDSIFKLKCGQKYTNSKKKMIFICPVCGDFECSFDSMKYMKKCPYCCGRRVKIGYNNVGYTNPEFIKFFKNKNDANKITKSSAS